MIASENPSANGARTADQMSLPYRFIDSDLPSWTIWLVVGIGSLLRVRQWWFDRSIWGDEAADALQILHRSYFGLTHPLRYEQAAPIGWLWLEKLATQIFGDSERALRLVPLIAGMGTLVLAALLAKRLLRPLAALLAVTILAVVEPLVYYSTEIKQYQTDAAITAAILLLAIVVLDHDFAPRWIVAWGVLSPLLVLTSFPGAFVVGVSTAVLGIRCVQRRPRALVSLGCGSLLWLAALGVEYWRVLRTLHKDPALASFWAAGYPPTGARFAGVVRWMAHTALGVVGNPVDLGVHALVLGLFVVGFVRIVRTLPEIAGFIGLLAAIVFAAAIARSYPLEGRLALYLDVPFVLVCCGAIGVRSKDMSTSARPVRLPHWMHLWNGCLSIAAFVSITILAIFPIRAAAVAVAKPYVTVESRPAIQFILRHLKKGDDVFVSIYDTGPSDYYGMTLGLRVNGTFQLDRTPGCSSDAAVRTMRGIGRVWLLFGYPPSIPSTLPGDTIANTEAKLRSLGTVRTTFYAYGPVAAVLIDPTRANHSRLPDTVAGCITAKRHPPGTQL